MTYDFLPMVGLGILIAVLLRLSLCVYQRRGYAKAERVRCEGELDTFRRLASQALDRSDDHSVEDVSWQGYRNLVVKERVEDARGGSPVCSFHLESQDGRGLAPFRPGQYLTFRVRPRGEPKPVVRCYSLSSAPNGNRYRVTVKRVLPPLDRPDAPAGRASSHFHDALQAGDVVQALAPRGHFTLEDSHAVVLIGAGIGVTPLVSMLGAIAKESSKRETWAFFGYRNEEEHILRNEVASLAEACDNVRLHVCYSQSDQRVTLGLLERTLPSKDFHFYVCGPSAMMMEFSEGLSAWGVPDERVHFEAFGPASVRKKKTTAPTTREGEAAEVPEVHFVASDKVFSWDPEADSLLDFAESHGIYLESGCRAGNCGSCAVEIASGEVAYRSQPGSPPAPGTCLTCIAIPSGPLALEA